MEYEFFTTHDNATLAYQTSRSLISSSNSNKDATTTATTATDTNSSTKPQPTTCILLIHGFSGSSEYFSRNTSTLSQNDQNLIITPDLRGHGRSEHTPQGYHVARLATDLHELITTRIQPFFTNTTTTTTTNNPLPIYAVGCSIGAAILWTYTELFTDHSLAGLIFVDQAPLQDLSTTLPNDTWGPGLAHYGCYDETTMVLAQKAWSNPDPKIREATYLDLVASCLGYRHQPLPPPSNNISAEQTKSDEQFFTRISRTCDGPWLARLLADHTRYDHRDAIEMISKPVLVMMGAKSGCFSVEGMMETVRRANMNKDRKRDAVGSVFEGSGHWLFWEEPERFGREVLGFVRSCEEGI